jgi:PPOX class probable F420-dependent enzyme
MIGRDQCVKYVVLSDKSLAHILENAPVARLGTIAADGAPSLVPVVFVWLDGAIWSPVDGKPKRTTELARLANVARDPRCTLLIDRYDADWRRLWWLRLACEATVRSPAPNDPIVARLETALRAKYPQYGATPPLLPPVRALELRIVKRLAWAADPSVWASPFD